MNPGEFTMNQLRGIRKKDSTRVSMHGNFRWIFLCKHAISQLTERRTNHIKRFRSRNSRLMQLMALHLRVELTSCSWGLENALYFCFQFFLLTLCSSSKLMSQWRSDAYASQALWWSWTKPSKNFLSPYADAHKSRLPCDRYRHLAKYRIIICPILSFVAINSFIDKSGN